MGSRASKLKSHWEEAMLATGSWASEDKKLHRHDPRLSVMGPNQIFIIDTHTLLAQNYAKPWYTRDMACFGKSLEASTAFGGREESPEIGHR